MSTLTITEFLEARIAEDEAVARLSLTDGADLAIETFNEDERDATNVLVIGKARVLAECAAKRAILANVPRNSDFYDLRAYTSAHTIHALAAVYADHGDYRQEWAL